MPEDPEQPHVHWNYRIVKYRDGSGYGLHEVYYDRRNGNVGRTEHPISFSCDAEEGPAALVEALERALKDAQEQPIFEEPE
jgi:hypothetical protein